MKQDKSIYAIYACILIILFLISFIWIQAKDTYETDEWNENLYIQYLDQCWIALDSRNASVVIETNEGVDVVYTGAFEARLYNISVLSQPTYPKGDCQRLRDACIRAEEYSTCVWVQKDLTCLCQIK
jgi:hypothetical protein